jgi:pyruvate, water dikinase
MYRVITTIPGDIPGMINSFNPFKWFKARKTEPSKDQAEDLFRTKYERFKELLDSNGELAKILTDLEEKLKGHQIFGMTYIRSQTARAVFHTMRMIQSLNAISKNQYFALMPVLESLNTRMKAEIEMRKEIRFTDSILLYSQINAEMVDWVGGKSANLGEILTRAKLPIPEGFAITTHASEVFLKENDLIDEINKLKMEIDPNQPETVNAVSEEIQRLIIGAPLPEQLKEAILSAYDQMIECISQGGALDFSPRVSLRSSAIGEDSELSFAGQYLSILNVPRDRITQSYKYVLASLYTPRAISYRLSKGIRDEDAAMSVACLQMVDSVASGVAYSHHPFNIMEDNIIINAVWGLGPYAVDGIITPDTYRVEKNDDLTILETKISPKPVQLVSNPEGGLLEIAVPEEDRERSCLSVEQIKILAGYSRTLEHHYGHPQDTEWALDKQGCLIILQTRPLHLQNPAVDCPVTTTPLLPEYPLLIECGAVASPGVGFGPAFHVNSEEDLAAFPEGAVLIAKHSSPKFVVVMQKAQAILTDAGSVSGHMASLAREFAVPTILGTKVATAAIPHGTEITVDAFSGRVYQGKVPELLRLQISRQSGIRETPVYQTLARIAKFIVPLNLIDPKSPDFIPDNCKTLHDIMRLVHECSYQQMFQISDQVSGVRGCSVSLAAPLPLDLCIIDLGGGLSDTRVGVKRVTVDKVASAPFKALLKGMLHEGVRYMNPRPVEIKGFFSVMSEQMLSPGHGSERFGDRSYAIISDKYLNFSSRVGYHYAILDSYCGQTVNNNYIAFSFKGGAADDTRRNRRARAIGRIMEELGFMVEVTGDRVAARFQKYERPDIEEKLDIMGRLLQFTRQLDMLMRSEAAVETVAKAFLEGNYNLE